INFASRYCDNDVYLVSVRANYKRKIMTPKKFNIDSFEKLLNIVTVDNVDNLSIDIYQWLRAYAHVLEKLKKEKHEVFDGKSNWEVLQATFMWIDDGKNDYKGTVVTNRQTGEDIYIKAKKK